MSTFHKWAAVSAFLAVAVTALVLPGPFTPGVRAQEGHACSLSNLVVVDSGTSLTAPVTDTTPAAPAFADVSFTEETCLFLQTTFSALAGGGAIVPVGGAGGYTDGCTLQDVLLDILTVSPGLAESIVMEIPSVSLSVEGCNSLWTVFALVASGQATPILVPVDLIGPPPVVPELPPELDGAEVPIEEPDDATDDEEEEANGNGDDQNGDDQNQNGDDQNGNGSGEENGVGDGNGPGEESDIGDGNGPESPDSSVTDENPEVIEDGEEETDSMIDDTEEPGLELEIVEEETTTVE